MPRFSWISPVEFDKKIFNDIKNISGRSDRQVTQFLDSLSRVAALYFEKINATGPTLGASTRQLEKIEKHAGALENQLSALDEFNDIAFRERFMLVHKKNWDDYYADLEEYLIDVRLVASHELKNRRETKSEGGAPPKSARLFLLSHILSSYEKYLQLQVSATRDGPFEQVVRVIFAKLGIYIEDIHKLVGQLKSPPV